MTFAVAFRRLAVENRRGERMSVTRPVRLGDRTGITRNYQHVRGVLRD